MNVVFASDNFCCILPTTCLGDEEAYGGYNVDFEDLDASCSDNGFEWHADTSCSNLPNCIEGCCIYKTETGWGSTYPTGKDSCSNSYPGENFFVEQNSETMSSDSECSAYFSTSEFSIKLKVVDSDGDFVDLNMDNSIVKNIATDETNELSKVSNSEYNYVLILGYGTYSVSLSADVGDAKRSIDVFEDQTHEFIMTSIDIPVAKLFGTIIDETGQGVLGVKITISGHDSPSISGPDGNYIVSNIDVTNSNLQRTISIRKEGYENYEEYLFLSEGDNLYQVVLESSEDNLTAQPDSFCCPSYLGCANGPFEEDSHCMAGSGEAGGLCSGTSIVEACAVPPNYCCASELHCDSKSITSLGCSPSTSFGCNTACKVLSECIFGEVTDACQCGNSYYDEGYCCNIGGKVKHSSISCDKVGSDVTGFIAGTPRYKTNLQTISGANVLVATTDNSEYYNIKTDFGGRFSITLPSGEYYVSAQASGFALSDKHYFSIVGNDGSYYHEVSGRDPAEKTSCKNSKGSCDDASSIFTDDELLTLGVINDGQHHSILLDERLKSCPTPKRVEYSYVNSIPGKKSLEVNWQVEDCLELAWFVIDKCTFSKDFEGNIENENCQELVQIPATERVFIDNDVKWSKLTKTNEKRDVIIEDIQNLEESYDSENYITWHYNYTITPIYEYGTQGILENLASKTQTAIVGDLLCEGRESLSDREFCGFRDDPTFEKYARSDFKLGLRTLRLKCDENNMIASTTDTFNNPTDCSAIENYDSRNAYLIEGNHISPICFGPFSGKTECREKSNCAIYGISAVGPFSLADNFNRCYGVENDYTFGDTMQNSCVFQPDRSITDKCVDCIEVENCLDYTSRNACEIDNCKAGRSNPKSEDHSTCNWVDTTFSSLGEGICVPSLILDHEDYCTSASRENAPLNFNLGWSEKLCDDLGDCISSPSEGCVNCNDFKTCERYLTEYACEGSLGNDISISYPLDGNTCGGLSETEYGPDIYYNYSSDGCKNLKCKWFPEDGKCFKDSNDNDIADSIEKDAVPGAILAKSFDARVNGNSDFVGPYVRPGMIELFFSETEGRDSVEFSSEELFIFEGLSQVSQHNVFGFRYCIDRDGTCCPNIDLTEDDYDGFKVSVPLIEHIKDNNLEDGKYNIRFLAQDYNFNIAPLESVSVFVDTQPPIYEVIIPDNFALVSGSDPVESYVDITLKSIGKIPDSDSIESMSCEYKIGNLKGELSPPILESHNLDEFGYELNMRYQLKDGLYKLYVTCEDYAGNVNDTFIDEPAKLIRVDQVEGFDIISPPLGGVVGNSNNVIFEFMTEVTSSCALFIKSNSNPEAEIQQLITTDGLIHKYTLPGLNVEEGVKKVFDGNYVASCIETGLSHQLPEIPLLFGVDEVPPVSFAIPTSTAFKEVKDVDSKFETTYYYNQNVSLNFDCYDPLIDASYPEVYAGCDVKDIKYCISNLPTADCNPDIDPTAVDYAGEGTFPEMDSAFSVCFRGKDLIDSSMNNPPAFPNEEEPKCISVMMNQNPPKIDLTIESEIAPKDSPYGFETYYVSGNEVKFSGLVKDDEGLIDELNFYVSTASGDELLIHPTNIEYDEKLGYFSGTIDVSADFYYAYGSNFLVVEATDFYGNKGVKFVRLFLDNEKPVASNIHISTEGYDNIEYRKPIEISFDADDVFWTHDIYDVEISLYSLSEYSNYDSGEISLTPVLVSSDLNSENDMSLVPTDSMSYGANNMSGIFTTVKSFEDFSKIKEYISSYDVSDADAAATFESIAEWKHFEYVLRPIEDSATRRWDIGIGEYALRITGNDVFGHEMDQRIIFNISDSEPPVIILNKPERQKIDDPRVRFTNNINELFEVFTDQPSDCYFDFGDRPTTNNLMLHDASRTLHRYVLSDFEPFDKAKLPFIITCSEHGIDLTSEQFSLIFDRKDLDLNMEVSSGERPVRALQKHIAEYSYDYTDDRFIGRTTVSVNDNQDKNIHCTYECNSPNSRCESASGSFNPEEYSSSQVKAFDLSMKDHISGNSYSWGDYLYTVVCEDEAGNIGKTEDLSLSVRTPSAPQELFIVDTYPTDIASYMDSEPGKVELSVTTNMISTCTYNIISPSGLNSDIVSGDMGNTASLTHKKNLELTSGSYKVSYECVLATDLSRRKSLDVGFLIPEFPRINYLDQVGTLPIFRVVSDSDFVKGYMYGLDNSTIASSEEIMSFNTDFIIIPGITYGDIVYAKIEDEFGEISPVEEFSVRPGTELMTSANLDYIYAAKGTYSRPIQPSSGIYYFTEEDVILSFSFRSDASAKVNIYIDNTYYPESQISDKSLEAGSGSFAGRLVNVDPGHHDIFIHIVHDDGSGDEYVHVKYARSIDAPKILSVSPDYLNGNEIEIKVSKPASCYALYPSSSSITGQAVSAVTDFGTEHTIVLSNLESPESFNAVAYISVMCSDSIGNSDQKNHLLRVDVTSPRINSLESDNSIMVTNNNGVTSFTVVRDEDAHVIVNADEYIRCVYFGSDNVEIPFADYFLENLHPHVSIPSDNGTTPYTIRCEDGAGNPSINRKIDITKNLNADVYIHDVYPIGPIGDTYPELEVFTYRNSICDVKVDEATEDTGFGAFFRSIGNTLFQRSIKLDSENVGHRFRHSAIISASGSGSTPLERDIHYKATVSCRAEDAGSSIYSLEFWYDGSIVTRPNIYIE